MKLVLNNNDKYQTPEIIINYNEITPKLQLVIDIIQDNKRQIIAKDAIRKTQKTIDIDLIYYIESVDRKTFIYLEKETLEIDYKLYEVLEELKDLKFCQINKNTILNIQKLEKSRTVAK